LFPIRVKAMIRVIIDGTTLSVSRFSLGTASLHHIGTLSQQREHLEAAAAVGFSHFDTAPLYGFGEAERAIGDAFGRTRDVTVATKLGLYPPGGCDQSRQLVLARKAVGRFLPSVSRAVADWSVERASDSLDASLQRLQRDRIDLLLLHEPNAELMATDEWSRWLERQSDRIGLVGIAGPKSAVAPFVLANSPLARVVQTRDSVETRESDFLPLGGRKLQFTYGYFANNEVSWPATKILEGALARNPRGSIVVSTRKRSRLAEFANASARDIQSSDQHRTRC
jgi:D-threo-aldose 1-dehydrogenase